MKRTADMMESAVVEETVKVSSDVFDKLVRELRVPADLLKNILSRLKYTQEQKAVLSKSSINNTTEQQKILADVFVALRFTNEQIEVVCEALFIPKDIIEKVHESYSMPTMDAARRFLIDLHRYGMMFHENKLFTYINSEFVAVNPPPDRRSKDTARANAKTIAGFKSYDELNAMYGELDDLSCSNKFVYLLWRYQSPEDKYSEDDKIRNIAVKAANDALCHGVFSDISNEYTRQKLRDDLIQNRTGENHTYSTKRRNRDLSLEQAEKFATIYIETYSQRFWTIAQYVYDALKHDTKPKNALMNMSIKDFNPTTAKPTAELLNEVNANSAIWGDARMVIVKIMVKNNDNKVVNQLMVNMYNPIPNNNNNNAYHSGNSSSTTYSQNR